MTARDYAARIFALALLAGDSIEEAEEAARAAFTNTRSRA